jgi:hypothetical protein
VSVVDRVCTRYHDGSLLIIFAGLFVVVAGAEKVLLTPEVVSCFQSFHLDNVWTLTAVTAVLSNMISNVPAVLALKPFVQSLTDRHHAWLVVAMSSTLAGSLTLVGSVANLIVAERARGRNRGVVWRLLSGWRAADSTIAGVRRMVAELNSCLADVRFWHLADLRSDTATSQMLNSSLCAYDP